MQWNFKLEPSGDVYTALLRSCLGLGATAGFVVRPGLTQWSPAARSFLTEVGQLEVTMTPTREWPGTQLLGRRTVDYYRVPFNAAVLEIVERHSSHLFEWISPDLPDDLHLLQEDGSVLLGNVAHEADAWLDCTDLELRQIVSGCPLLPEYLAT